MARSIDSDPLSSSDWYLIELPSVAINALAFPIKTGLNIAQDQGFVSFQSVTVPTMTTQTKRIQEGNWPYTHSVATSACLTSQVRIKQAVVPANQDFFLWFHIGLMGRALTAPRKTFVIVQTRKDKTIPRREIILWDCIPVEWTPTSELNSTNAEIAIEEIVMDCNRIEVLPGVITGV